MTTEIQDVQKYFDSDAYRQFIFLRTYSRWDDNLGRRETWVEVVDRFMAHMKTVVGRGLDSEEYNELREAILWQKVMPSMRLLWCSGDAVAKNNASAFNCTYTAIDSIERFPEILFLLCSGCGVGFSVEQQFVDKLPEVVAQTGKKLATHVVGDSREGWANALKAGVNAWWSGKDLDFDYSKVRPMGARLKTFGGRASGPLPLMELLVFARAVILLAQGRKLRPLEVHDIVTKIAMIVVAGGTRRSSEISISDLHDEEMMNAKHGKFYDTHPNRSMANNSAVYTKRPTQQEFMTEWLQLMKSGSGERGIFNRDGVRQQMPARRKRVNNEEQMNALGPNPCAEIILRSQQMCNLTSVVCRAEDTKEDLMNKVRLATILGTYQSMLTNFKYLNPTWQKNCEEERLLGVSLNGQYDSKEVRKHTTLKSLRGIAIKTNKKYAKRFKINPSTAITCTKPEGTGSQMLNCAPGAHPRYAKYYIRRVRISATDPLFKLLADSGVPYHPEVGQKAPNITTYVLEFPIKAPENAITRHDVTAIDQLKHWKKVKQNYAEHTVSSTIYVGEEEWVEVAAWLWRNWNAIGGLSFLPREDDDHIYALAPYTEIDENKYNKLISKFPEVDYSLLSDYEKDDNTQGSRELACTSGSCEIDAELFKTLKIA